MLIGRGPEQERIEALLTNARRGQGGGLVLRGEAGVGKTALLEYGLERADGMQPLRARGIESEAELAFSGLLELLRPLLPRVERLPSPQRDALLGALAVGDEDVPGRFAVGAATLAVLAAAAEECPLLLVCDDCQWLDASSLDALVFAVRRLPADPVALLASVRDSDGRGPPARAFDEIRLTGLDQASAKQLLEDTLGRSIPQEVAEQIVRRTGGNPLALREIPSVLTSAELDGDVPLRDPLPTSATIEEAFVRRSAELPAETRRALVVAAALDSADTAALAPALRLSGLGGAALEPAEAAGLVRVAPALEFVHPLMRSAVYQAASREDRRNAHVAIAEALPAADADRKAWHRAQEIAGADEEIARALEESAERALGRGGYSSAAAALKLAAECTPDSETRGRRLLDAADAAQLAGAGDLGLTLLDAAASLAVDADLRGRIEQRRAWISYFSGDVERAYQLASAEAERLEAGDAPQAARLYGQLAGLLCGRGDPRRGLAFAERALTLAPADAGPSELASKTVYALVLICLGRIADAIPYARRAAEIYEADRLNAAEPLFGVVIAQNLAFTENLHRARPLFNSLIAETRNTGNLVVLTAALAVLAGFEEAAGNWHLARSLAEEAVDLASDTHERPTVLQALAVRTLVDAGQGRADDARAAANDVLGSTIARDELQLRVLPRHALGRLALAAGRAEDAIAELEPAVSALLDAGVGEPGVVATIPDLVEAYARDGRLDDARDLVSRFSEIAELSGLASQAALAARCRGIVAGEGGFEPGFAEALRLYEDVEAVFDRARTELSYGERLRRAKRRVEARKELRRALARFERLGAEPWAERARTELRASGETIRRPDPGSRDDLTPQELTVAMRVAEGMSNREAAAALFVSPKTIEAHLGRAYRKLGIRSRGELTRLFAGGPVVAAEFAQRTPGTPFVSAAEDATDFRGS